MIKEKGHLIVIEGGDGSGKATQTEKIFNRLLALGKEVRKISFPRYENDSSTLVKMYLNGDFGDKASEVSPYIASTFYACDRYASFKQDWEEFYTNGGTILMDRYTTSNMVHQGGKIQNIEERNLFLDWIWDFEHNIFKLPIPTEVFFLDLPTKYTQLLMQDRNNEITNTNIKDIHERDSIHLHDAYDCAIRLAQKYQWIKIDCIDNNMVRSINDINDEIYNKVISIIGKS